MNDFEVFSLLIFNPYLLKKMPSTKEYGIIMNSEAPLL
jgi:hypothetical protein